MTTVVGAHVSVPAPKGRRVRRSAWHYIGLGLSAGLLGVVLLLALMAIVVPKLANAIPMTILTTSMEPKLPPGTLIIVKPTPIEQIKVGDVMTYQIRAGDPAVISHRVIKVDFRSDGTRTFVTKGDNNAEADPVVIPQQVRGVVWYSVPWIGYVNNVVNGPNRTWIVSALALLLIGYAAFMITSGAVAAVGKRRARAGTPAHRHRR